MSSPSSFEFDKKEIETFQKNYEIKDLNLDLVFNNLLQLKPVKNVNILFLSRISII